MRSNDTARQPNAFCVFDCEAFRTPGRFGEIQTFRLAVARWRDRHANDCPWNPPETFQTTDPGALWLWISRRAKRHERLVCVAHNAAYDLRVSEAIPRLAALGWALDPPLVGPRGTTLRFTYKRYGITVIDSLNWLPAKLEEIGPMVGAVKAPLPADDAPESEWFERCRGDVDILDAAWMRLMGWVESDDLGTWQRTGAGQAMTVWRHRFLSHRVLIHRDEPARAAEREGAWCGRAEAWRVGRFTAGPYDEWDLKTAYGRIMADCEVPTVLRQHVVQPTARALSAARRRHAVLARVHVTTDVPCVPHQAPERIWWPVGRFRTTLWDHEWALVEAHGGTVEVEEAWIYDRAPALQRFARWAMALTDPQAEGFDPVVGLAAKHMLRAIVGKFGSRFWNWEPQGPSPEPELQLILRVDPTDPECRWQLTVAGQWYWQGPPADSEQSCPQIMSWIQAETRRRLWEGMQRAGTGNVLYVDTDGMIVTPAGSHRMAMWDNDCWRVKSTWDDVEILATRRLILDGKLRASGIPLTAQRIGRRTWKGEVWPELLTSLRRGEPDRIVVRQGIWHLNDNEFRRCVGLRGSTAAYGVDEK